MGLDMYLQSNKTLNPSRKTERRLITYLESLQLTDQQQKTGYYFWTGPDRVAVNRHRLPSQIGDIINAVNTDGKWQITVMTMSWRKANQIHAWFIDNVQDGVDNCGEYAVSSSNLINLNSAISKVLVDRVTAETILPNLSGNFFGGLEYDQFYFEDLTYTQKLINKMLTKKAFFAEWELVYCSSW